MEKPAKNTGIYYIQILFKIFAGNENILKSHYEQYSRFMSKKSLCQKLCVIIIV